MSRAGTLVRVALAVAPLLSIPAVGRAQTAAPAAAHVADADARRGFEDSWFWGAKGGVMRFGTITEGDVYAPLAGAEWLITRRYGALLVGGEQAFFDRTSAVFDENADDGVRPVAISDARRYSVAALAFPGRLGPVRPYAGVGFALEVIRAATPDGEFNDMGHVRVVAERVDAGQSRTSAFFIGGAQLQFGRAAVFVQGTAAGAQSRSLFNKGGTAQLEAGLRFNLASAFER